MNLRIQRFLNARNAPAALDAHVAKMKPDAWPPGQETVILNYEQHTRDSKHDKYQADKIGFQARIRDAIASGKDLQLIIDDNFPSSVIDFPSIRNRITKIDINSNTTQNLTFKSAQILKVNVGGAAPRHRLNFNQCHLHELSVFDDQNIHLELNDTWVSVLNIKKSGVRHLEMHGGGILSIVVQSGDSYNPFTGPVTIKDVYLPREPGTGMTPQRLRDVRSHLLKMNNILAAGVFHSAELALDRPIESSPHKFFSWIYEVMADFGNSSSRALKSLLFFFVVMTSLCFFGDTVREPDLAEAVGWKSCLVGNSVEAKALRSFAYATSSILNPLGIMQSKPLVISKSPYWTAGLALIGLGGTLSIVFLVITVRRRFKLE